MTVRKAITRGKQTFRVKFPSRKNDCMVHCETILEADTARFLEISPHVRGYRAQPSVEIYYDQDGEPRRYYPDFRAVLTDDSEVDIEVKPERRLRDPRVKAKISAVIKRYAELGRSFRIFTDREVRAEPLYGNLQLIFRHSRTPVDEDRLRLFKKRIKQQGCGNVAEAARVLGGEQHVYRLISEGFLGIDFNQSIIHESRVWIREMGGKDDSLRI